MKLVIVSNGQKFRGGTYELNAIVKRGKERGWDVEIVDVAGFHDVGTLASLQADVYFYRTSSMTPGLREGFLGRTTLLRSLPTNAVVINGGVMQWPHIQYKLFQQKVVALQAGVRGIDTWHWRTAQEVRAAVVAGEVQLPLVQKPNIGAYGSGVTVHRDLESLNAIEDDQRDFIWQPFIENDGDFRVLMMGGVCLGVMHRKGRAGIDVNNVSQGGMASVVEDSEIIRDLQIMAGRIGSLLEVSVFGLDVVQDKNTGDYYFLEVNVPSQWEGFEKATGVDVSEKFVGLCERLVARRDTDFTTLSAVRSYYAEYAHTMTHKKQWHWHSRMWLWSGTREVGSDLRRLKKYYLGDSHTREEVIYDWVRANTDTLYESLNWRELRMPVLKKYPRLLQYEQLLVKVQMARAVFGEDWMPDVRQVLSDDELLEYTDSLLTSPGDVAILSSWAINYLYLSHSFVRAIGLDARWVLNVGKEAVAHTDAIRQRLGIYLLLHAIIGESLFYSQPVHNSLSVYEEMLAFVEAWIAEHFAEVSLDLKLEFLVCCRLVGVGSFLEKVIFSEANTSLSPVGDFIVDTHNETASRSFRKALNSAEHTNALYALASEEFRYNAKR